MKIFKTKTAFYIAIFFLTLTPASSAQFTGGVNDGTDSFDSADRDTSNETAAENNIFPEGAKSDMNLRGGIGENANDLLGTGIRPSTGRHVATREDGRRREVFTPTHGSNVTG